MKSFVGLTFCLLITFNSLAASEYPAIEKGGFEKAKLKAKEEGKMLFLDFYASWCTPCKWMDETTFKDLEIRNLLDQKYIAVKVNIDDFEGFELKSKFDIRFLPTIIIFNHDGVMIERVEETIGTQKLKDLLKTHAENNAPFIKHKVNTSPRELTQTTVENTIPEPYVDDTKSSYRMQVGVYSTIEGANTKSEELKKIFEEKITIIQIEKEGKILYKVLLGEFSSLSEAKSFKVILADQFQIASVVF